MDLLSSCCTDVVLFNNENELVSVYEKKVDFLLIEKDTESSFVAKYNKPRKALSDNEMNRERSESRDLLKHSIELLDPRGYNWGRSLPMPKRLLSFEEQMMKVFKGHLHDQFWTDLTHELEQASKKRMRSEELIGPYMKQQRRIEELIGGWLEELRKKRQILKDQLETEGTLKTEIVKDQPETGGTLTEEIVKDQVDTRGTLKKEIVKDQVDMKPRCPVKSQPVKSSCSLGSEDQLGPDSPIELRKSKKIDYSAMLETGGTLKELIVKTLDADSSLNFQIVQGVSEPDLPIELGKRKRIDNSALKLKFVKRMVNGVKQNVLVGSLLEAKIIKGQLENRGRIPNEEKDLRKSRRKRVKIINF